MILGFIRLFFLDAGLCLFFEVMAETGYVHRKINSTIELASCLSGHTLVTANTGKI